MRFFIVFLLLSLLPSTLASAEEALSLELSQALSLYDDGQLLEAYSRFKDYYVQNPAQKEAAFLLALSKWKMMWLSTYNSDDKKEVMDLLEKVQAMCEPVMEKDLAAHFYYAASIGVQAQIAATDGDWWQTAQLGKKMKHHAQQILKVDPEYYKANYLLGSFNYFADALPGYLKFLRSLLFLPGGDRKEGSQQLVLAFQKGGLVEGEAGKTLAIIYTYYEKRPDYGIQMCNLVLASHPKSYEVGLYKGINLYFNESWEEAEQWLQSVRKEVQQYSELHESKGIVPVYMPLEREIRYWICRSLIQQKKFDEARLMLQELLDPPIHQPYWLMRGILLSQAQLEYEQGNSEAAERKIETVLRWKDVKDSHEKANRLRNKQGKVDLFEIDFL